MGFPADDIVSGAAVDIDIGSDPDIDPCDQLETSCSVEINKKKSENKEKSEDKKMTCEQKELKVTADDKEAVVTLEGVLPKDVSAEVQTADTENIDLLQNEAVNDEAALYAYDISLYSEGEEYEPQNGAVTVSLSGEEIKKACKEGRELAVWHIDDNGVKEKIENISLEGDTIVFEAESFSKSNEDGEPVLKINHNELSQINRDYVCWLYALDGKISYPVVKGRDNAQYLHKTFFGDKSFVGSIFIDYRCQIDDFQTMIYGHSMKDKTMFRLLADYTDKAYAEQYPYIYIYTPRAEKNMRSFQCMTLKRRKFSPPLASPQQIIVLLY